MGERRGADYQHPLLLAAISAQDEILGKCQGGGVYWTVFTVLSPAPTAVKKWNKNATGQSS